MSTRDIWVVIPKRLEAVAKQANESGAIVKVVYDVERIAFCTDGRIATSIEIVD